jgi:hypothetical protein
MSALVRRTRSARSGVIGGTLLLLACGGTSAVGIGDAGKPDGRSGVDAGGGTDSSVGDTGVGADTTVPVDSGAGADTGVVEDTSADTSPADTGSPIDSAQSDSGSPGDSGSDSGMLQDSMVQDTGTDARDDAGMCPAAVPSGDCTPSGLGCYYPGQTCYCSHGAPPMVNLTWHCTPLAAGCPEPAPAVGSACSQPGLMCDYGACIGGTAVQCTVNKWTPALVICPP